MRAQRTLDRELVPSVRPWASVVGSGPPAGSSPQTAAAVIAAERLRGAGADGLHRGGTPSQPPRRGRRGGLGTRQPTLPGARRIAGSFATTSGPNCFGTVMAAAGVVDADTVWMQREPFERWLSEKTRPNGDDAAPGTVLVWRSPDGLVQHAAVTLGDGWVLHKPSQGWMSPNKVLTTLRAARQVRERPGAVWSGTRSLSTRCANPAEHPQIRLLVDFSYGSGRARLLSRCPAVRSHMAAAAHPLRVWLTSGMRVRRAPW